MYTYIVFVTSSPNCQTNCKPREQSLAEYWGTTHLAKV